MPVVLSVIEYYWQRAGENSFRAQQVAVHGKKSLRNVKDAWVTEYMQDLYIHLYKTDTDLNIMCIFDDDQLVQSTIVGAGLSLIWRMTD